MLQKSICIYLNPDGVIEESMSKFHMRQKIWFIAVCNHHIENRYASIEHDKVLETGVYPGDIVGIKWRASCYQSNSCTVSCYYDIIVRIPQTGLKGDATCTSDDHFILCESLVFENKENALNYLPEYLKQIEDDEY